MFILTSVVTQHLHKLILSVCWMNELKIENYLYSLEPWNETNKKFNRVLSVGHFGLRDVHI